MGSGIIHILTIESHDIIKHTLGLDSRTVRVKRNSLDIAVDGLVPLAPFAGLNMVGDSPCHISAHLLREPGSCLFLLCQNDFECTMNVRGQVTY